MLWTTGLKLLTMLWLGLIILKRIQKWNCYYYPKITSEFREMITKCENSQFSYHFSNFWQILHFYFFREIGEINLKMDTLVIGHFTNFIREIEFAFVKGVKNISWNQYMPYKWEKWLHGISAQCGKTRNSLPSKFFSVKSSYSKFLY